MKAFLAGHAAGAESLDTTRAQLQLAVERMTAFCDAVAPSSAVVQALRDWDFGDVWDELLDAVKALPPRNGCAIWEVQNLTDGCPGCPAGGYEECLVSPVDARVTICDRNGKALDASPDNCPLRNGGSVLLVGEPGS